jgi:methylase of polypeptide subunit release factors
MFQQSVQFFPSTDVIAKEVYYEAQIKSKHTVLDPTAGNGVLLDAVKSYKDKWSGVQTFGIEIDQELRFILQGKSHKVIGTDFLEYADPIKFDRIIMNPPFANGCEMVLKAWNQHFKDDGRLVAILNRETIANPYSGDRKVLANLIEAHGTIKELGKAFENAARKTKVEVVMITLQKPERKADWGFSGGTFTHDEVTAEEFKANPLAHTSLIKNLVAKYKACEAIVVQRHETQSKLNFYLDDVSRRTYYKNREKDEVELKVVLELSDEIAELKSRFWNTIFEKTELSTKATSSFKEKFTDFTKDQALMEFAEQNIIEMLSMFFLNRDQIMNDCLTEVFEEATGFHEKNKIYKEGWKTNKSYKLSKRIIYPNAVLWNKVDKTQMSYRFLSDIDKVLCWLSGKSIDASDFMGVTTAIYKFIKNSEPITNKFESTFFLIRIYKKGTVHLDFKDLYLLDDFNLAAAKGKKWIGADY